MTSTETGNSAKTNRVVHVKQKKRWSLKISGAAIFSALSLGLYFAAEDIPRFQWGLAWFDPVSIVWVLTFFIFGYEAGIISSVLGMILLMPFDPFTPIGPIMKFTATIPLIVLPWLISKVRNFETTSEQHLKLRRVILNWIISVSVRLIVMVIFNCVVISIMFGEAFVVEINLEFIGISGITGWTAIIITVLAVNLVQSIWDYLIPYVLYRVIKTQITIPW